MNSPPHFENPLYVALDRKKPQKSGKNEYYKSAALPNLPGLLQPLGQQAQQQQMTGAPGQAGRPTGSTQPGTPTQQSSMTGMGGSAPVAIPQTPKVEAKGFNNTPPGTTGSGTGMKAACYFGNWIGRVARG